MKRWMVAVLSAAVVGTALAPAAEAQLPKLYSGAATDYTRKALVREFPFTEDETSREINCNRRLSRVRFKCRVSFFAGDTSWRGDVKVRHILKAGNRLGYRYLMRLTQANEYCIFVLDKPREQCQENIKEKGNGYASRGSRSSSN